MLANKLIKDLAPTSVTVAEDVSGMPTLGRTVEDGGIGFDYRLSMFLPDLWIKLLKETPDEQWKMGHITHSMTNRRWKEKCVAYAESHDQAIVGDKTIAMWLFDKDIYTGMSRLFPANLTISRGMALHKMIRLLTQSLGGEAFLCFMGNEFGHPEWIDFPREGNGFSYAHCRRQWSLVHDKNLRYMELCAFDKEMNKWDEVLQTLDSNHQYVTLAHEEDRIIAYERGRLLFVFNFHADKSYENYKIGTCWKSDHMLLFDSDQQQFGGFDRLKSGYEVRYVAEDVPWQNRQYSVNLYIPCRTALVLVAEENVTQQMKTMGVKMPSAQ